MATKGYDDSPPRNATIVFYTVLTLAILVAIKLTLDTYFVTVMTAEVHDKVLTRGMEPVKAMRAREQAVQDAPAMQRAMEALSQRGRTASPEITPKSGMGEDGAGLEEVRGWTKLDRKIGPVAQPDTSATGITPAADANAAPGLAPAPTAPAAAPAEPGATH